MMKQAILNIKHYLLRMINLFIAPQLILEKLKTNG